MSYIIEHKDESYIYLAYLGDVEMAEVKQLIHELSHFIKEKNCYRLLTDFRDARMVMSLGMLFEIPKLLIDGTKEAGISVYEVKRAMVASARMMEKLKFFATISASRSQMIRLFGDIDEARTWLLLN
jgi:hypothetical protein